MSKDMAFGLIALGVSLCILFLCFRLLDRWCHWKVGHIPEPQAASQASISAIDELEQSIGGKLPAILRNAFLDGSITRVPLPVTFSWYEEEYVIVMFIRADAQANKQLADSCAISDKAFIFAMDDMGDYYLVKPDDNVVYCWDEEIGVIKEFESIEQWWKLLRGPSEHSTMG